MQAQQASGQLRFDQFQKVLERENMTHSVDGEAYSLYSLRHFYAVQMLTCLAIDDEAIVFSPKIVSELDQITLSKIVSLSNPHP